MLASPLTRFDVARYIDDQREEWSKERVVRRMVWEDSDFVTFLNRGPTPDLQYHIGPGDEIFIQHEGELHLHYLEGRERKLVVLKAGEMFLLPAGVPHSPRRPEGSWTFVIERKRRAGDVDRFMWACAQCGEQLDAVSAPEGGPRDTKVGDIPPFVAAVNRRLEALGSCPSCGAAVRRP